MERVFHFFDGPGSSWIVLPPFSKCEFLVKVVPAACYSSAFLPTLFFVSSSSEWPESCGSPSHAHLILGLGPPFFSICTETLMMIVASFPGFLLQSHSKTINHITPKDLVLYYHLIRIKGACFLSMVNGISGGYKGTEWKSTFSIYIPGH